MNKYAGTQSEKNPDDRICGRIRSTQQVHLLCLRGQKMQGFEQIAALF